MVHCLPQRVTLVPCISNINLGFTEMFKYKIDRDIELQYFFTVFIISDGILLGFIN